MVREFDRQNDEREHVFKFHQKLGAFHSFKKHPETLRNYDACSVDIIIPYHGRYDLVRRALKSVLEFTKSNPYLVTLVDDGSPVRPATRFIDIIKQAPQTNCMRLEEPRGFGAAINAGLAATEQPFVCIMHSDCQVRTLNWLEAMGESLVKGKKSNIRLIVPRTDNPGDDEIPELKALHTEYTDDVVATASLPFYCFLCHRDLFKRIGPIKEYPYTWFENEEFHYRMKAHGYKQAICGRSWIHHDGSATVKQLWRQHPTAEETMLENRDRCINDIKNIRVFR